MDFPLIPSRSSHLPFQEKKDLSPQSSPESPLVPQLLATHPALIRSFSPMGNTLFIDVEFQEISDQLDLSTRFPRLPDFKLRSAFSKYQNAAQKKQRNLHTIDLYV
jgi:hypothetical protein